MFTIFCLLCLCWMLENKEYNILGSFQNKSVSSCFKGVPEYVLFLDKLKGERRPFWQWISIDLSSKLALKVLIIVFLLTCTNREHPGNFQNKSVSSPSIESPGMFSSWPMWRGRKAFFGGCKKMGLIVILPPKTTWLS